MDKHYKKQGLKIIGVEIQKNSKASVEKVAKKLNIKFPLTHGSQAPAILTGIPRVFAFDPWGQLIFTGLPTDPNFEASVKKTLRDYKKLSRNSGRKSNLPEVKKPLIEQRSWKNTDNKKITASVISATETEVEFKLSNGKKVKYPISKLSEADQNLIKEAAAHQDKD